jgi:hypothetical protein
MKSNTTQWEAVMTKKQMILNHAKNLVKTNAEATIDDLIKRCYFATEEEVFEAIAGTKYSTLINSRGDD